MAKKQTREQRYLDALRWALGSNGEFPERQPGQGAYYWRMELMKRAGLKWDGEQFQPAAGVKGLVMADGSPLLDYLNVGDDPPETDEWTKGFHEARRRLYRILAPQITAGVAVGQGGKSDA